MYRKKKEDKMYVQVLIHFIFAVFSLFQKVMHAHHRILTVNTNKTKLISCYEKVKEHERIK